MNERVIRKWISAGYHTDPRSAETPWYIRLDDLDAEKADQVAAHVFMVIRTSPGNQQAWVAMKNAREDFARRLRKGAGADPTASGATRIGGSLNFKLKYAPAFPLVEITRSNAGHVVTAAELKARGFVAAPEEPRPPAARVSHRGSPRRWPSYQLCVKGAPPIHQGDRPADPGTGLHVWEHNNLAQKNLTVVDLKPNMFLVIPLVLISALERLAPRYQIEVWRDRSFGDYPVSLISTSKELLTRRKTSLRPLEARLGAGPRPSRLELLDCGGRGGVAGRALAGEILTSHHPDWIAERFPGAWEAPFDAGGKASIRVTLPARSQTLADVLIEAPVAPEKGRVIKTHVVERHVRPSNGRDCGRGSRQVNPARLTRSRGSKTQSS